VADPVLSFRGDGAAPKSTPKTRGNETMRNGTKNFRLAVGVGLTFVALGLLGLVSWPPSALRAGTPASPPPLTVMPSPSSPDNDNTRGTRPFDFSDAFYLQNGINPANILNRVNGTCPANDMPSCSVVDSSNTDPDRRNIRVLSTTGGFDHEGNPLFYDINGMVTPSTFTNDAAGKNSRGHRQFLQRLHISEGKWRPLEPGAVQSKTG
jgi:hypothetical protein